MATTEFSLAGVQLAANADYTVGTGGFEVPQDLEVGLETWGSVHRIPQTGSALPKIITQTFGIFPKPITWTANFLGSTAEARAKSLKAVQQSQQVVAFKVGSRRWDVVIWDFKEKIRSRYDIEYTIELRPLVDKSGSTPGGSLWQAASTNLGQQYSNLSGLATSAP